jgi:hypothetical protein
MTDAAEDDDEYEDELPALSLAMPPLYVLRAVTRCPLCGKAVHVYTLGCVAYRDAEDRRPVEDFHLLSRIESVPDPVLTLLRFKCPSYYPDRQEGEHQPYLMNHCRCGIQLDDDYLHGDVGAAFCPDTPEGYERFKLFRLPIAEPIPVESSFSLGGDEYLDFAKAEVW